MQLMLLAYQIRNDQDVRLIRVWAVTSITPVASLMESLRGGLGGFFHNYFFLLDVRQENQQLRENLEKTRLENYFLKAQLETADRANALAIFQAHSPNKMVPAQVISNATGPGDKVVIIDRGTNSGIRQGMGVITPWGIVGKVVSVYPNASFVMLATDPAFAAGVISEKHRVPGTVKGQGGSTVMVDYVQNEREVDEGEAFLTSGDDRIFPKGLPVGIATTVSPGRDWKEVVLIPSGFEHGLEAVLVIIEGVHMLAPQGPQSSGPLLLQPPPPAEPGTSAADPATAQLNGGSLNGVAAIAQTPHGHLTTDADRVTERIRAIGAAQRHVFGERGTGAPDFNLDPKAAVQPPAATPPSAPALPTSPEGTVR